MTRQALDAYAKASIHLCDPQELAELRDVTIDRSLPVADRVSRFLAQVGNPYLFKVDGMVVKVNYGGSQTLSTALAGLLAAQESPVLVESDP